MRRNAFPLVLLAVSLGTVSGHQTPMSVDGELTRTAQDGALASQRALQNLTKNLVVHHDGNIGCAIRI